MENFGKVKATKNYYYFSLGYYYFSVGSFLYKKLKLFLSNGFFKFNYIC